MTLATPRAGPADRFIACLNDPRDPDITKHTLSEMVRQRIYGILAGYEDCNDHDTLRGDPVLKKVSGKKPKDNDLASQTTLTSNDNPCPGDRVPVADPTLPVEALSGKERRR